MDNVQEFCIVIIILILGFVILGLKLFTKSYLEEKGKNLATKEDIKEITDIVEETIILTLDFHKSVLTNITRFILNCQNYNDNRKGISKNDALILNQEYHNLQQPYN